MLDARSKLSIMKITIYFSLGMISMLSDVVVVVFCLQFSQNSYLLASMMEQINDELRSAMEVKLLIFKKKLDLFDKNEAIAKEAKCCICRQLGKESAKSTTSKNITKYNYEVSQKNDLTGRKNCRSLSSNANPEFFTKNIPKTRCSQKQSQDKIITISIINSDINSINETSFTNIANQTKILPNFTNYSEFDEIGETSYRSHSNFRRNLTSSIKLLDPRKIRHLSKSKDTGSINVTSTNINPELLFEDPQTLIKILCKMRKFYGGFMKSLRTLNEALNPLLLLQMTVLIICLVLNAYLVVQFLIKSEENSMFVLSLTRLVVHALSILYLLLSSENLYCTVSNKHLQGKSGTSCVIKLLACLDITFRLYLLIIKYP